MAASLLGRQIRSRGVKASRGYRANRNRVLDHIHDNQINNVIILSGDSHANWVSDLARKLLSLRTEGQYGTDGHRFRSERYCQVSCQLIGVLLTAHRYMRSYDPETGKGSFAVEFAGVCLYLKLVNILLI